MNFTTKKADIKFETIVVVSISFLTFSFSSQVYKKKKYSFTFSTLLLNNTKIKINKL